MGYHKNITSTSFPAQGDLLGRAVQVCFHDKLDEIIDATVVRDDREEPCEMIFRLADGRYVRSVECLYKPFPVPIAPARPAGECLTCGYAPCMCDQP